MKKRIGHLALTAAAVGALTTWSACTLRTESKIETVSKIDAHIVLDIRQEASQVESAVRAPDGPAPAASPTPAGRPEAALRLAGPRYELAARSWLEALDPSGAAWADDAPAATPTPDPAKEPKVSAEAKKKAIEERKARSEKIDKALSAGELGENEHGYIAVLLKPGETSPRAKEVNALAGDENRDRRAIYLAIYQSKMDDKQVTLPAVELIFADQIREKLKEGQTFQAPSDKKLFEDFQKTPLGKLYADAKPGQWLKKKKAS